MTRSLRTLVVAGVLAVAGVAASPDRAAAQYPYYPGYYSGYTPYAGGFGYSTGYSTAYTTGFASPFFPGGYAYSSGYQTGFYSAPGFGYGYYPMAPSNVWTGSYYVSPATAMWLHGLRR